MVPILLLVCTKPNLGPLKAGQTNDVSHEIHYELKMSPADSKFHVEMDLTALDSQTTFHIPAWTPGYYHIENFQNGISNVEVLSQTGNKLVVNHPDSRTWDVSTPKNSKIKITYDVDGTDPGLGFFGSMLNSTEGYINGASAYMYVDGQMKEPDTLKVDAPNGWQIASALSFGTENEFVAKTGYDEFIDSPLQLGHFQVRTFTVDNVPFRAIYVSPTQQFKCNLDVLTNHLKIVSLPALEMFKDHSFSHYTYFIHFQVGNFAGGLEHRSSTCIAIADSPDFNIDSIAAHENFHAWNVKQIRPSVLGPFDYSKPAITGALWFMEGVTDYYADLLTYRSGLEGKDWLLNTYANQIAQLQNSEDRKTMTLEECSKKCWQSGGFGYGDLSYYNKGLVAGLILDAAMRSCTQGKKSLDDVMRYLYEKYKLPNAGFGDDGILDALNEVSGIPHGFDNLYYRMIRSTQEMPYSILRSIGLQVAAGMYYPMQRDFSVKDGLVDFAGTHAQAAGLLPNDEVVSWKDNTWNGVTGTNNNNFIIVVERGNQSKTIKVPYLFGSDQPGWLIESQNTGVEQIKLRQEWLDRPNPIVAHG